MAKQFTAANFETEVLQAAGPVLVDFWATWCMPCRMQGPAIDKLAAEGYNVGKVNVDEENELAAQFHVMNIPTLIIFKGGKEVDRMVGTQSRDVLAQKLDSYK
ncbi:MAG: thioredoxin [Eubacteriales bacterium]|nr:thioredoxin [Eubacteriales bacterium]